MSEELTILLYWAVASLVMAIAGLIGILRSKNVYFNLICTYFIAQPFAWSILIIANGGGSIILPVPDIIGIYLFFTGIVTYEMSNSYASFCFPPSPISSLIASLLVFFIARRFKSVAYYHWFRKTSD